MGPTTDGIGVSDGDGGLGGEAGGGGIGADGVCGTGACGGGIVGGAIGIGIAWCPGGAQGCWSPGTAVKGIDDDAWVTAAGPCGTAAGIGMVPVAAVAGAWAAGDGGTSAAGAATPVPEPESGTWASAGLQKYMTCPAEPGAGVINAGAGGGPPIGPGSER